MAVAQAQHAMKRVTKCWLEENGAEVALWPITRVCWTHARPHDVLLGWSWRNPTSNYLKWTEINKRIETSDVAFGNWRHWRSESSRSGKWKVAPFMVCRSLMPEFWLKCICIKRGMASVLPVLKPYCFFQTELPAWSSAMLKKTLNNINSSNLTLIKRTIYMQSISSLMGNANPTAQLFTPIRSKRALISLRAMEQAGLHSCRKVVLRSDASLQAP